MGRYTIKPRSYPTSVDERAIIAIVGGKRWILFLRVVPSILSEIRYDGWSKLYQQSEIAYGIPIYRGHNSQNRPIPILVYGQQDYFPGILAVLILAPFGSITSEHRKIEWD